MKAIALISGGLDSILAARLIKEQGVTVIALHFYLPFCSRQPEPAYGCSDGVKKASEQLGIELKIANVSNEFLPVLKSPRYGYGSHINPCIDCKILMLRQAKASMAGWGADFVITGEVLGQRPMSQHKQALAAIEKGAGLEGLIVRPLSAKLLPETVPEKEGWLCREKLLDFNGRGRRRQMDLARDLGIQDYANPAGGCLLTDPFFSNRIKDLIAHRELELHNVELLKAGRHFRLSEGAKLVVGRDEKENQRLLGLAMQGDYLFMPPDDVAGATALGRGTFDDALLSLAGSITSRYFDLDGKALARVICKKFPAPGTKELEVEVFTDSRLSAIRI